MSEAQRLGVNIDHVATLRNARGEAYPDPVDAALLAIAHGADGITLHLREDRRHIRDADVFRMKAGVDRPINLEMAATDEMLAIALKAKPNAVCLVPEKRTEVTTEGGLDVVSHTAALRPVVQALRAAGIKVSMFIDPDEAQMAASQAIGATTVELHTGAYAHGTAGELARLQAAALLAPRFGLECHAGHGLTYDNVAPVAVLPHVVELNIGHFLIAAAVFEGLGPAVARMKALMAKARGG